MADKIGRNDPCPCGSGKKYKKCCLAEQVPAPFTREERASASAKLDQFIDDVFEKENDFALADFWDDYLDRDEEINPGFLRLSDAAFDNWFSFDRKLSNGKFVVDEFLERDSRDHFLSSGERAFLETLRATTMHLYEVIDLVPGMSVTLRDVIEGEQITVHEKSGSRTMGRFEWYAVRVCPRGASGKPEMEGDILQITRLVREAALAELKAMLDDWSPSTPEDRDRFYKEMPPFFHHVWMGSILDPPIPKLMNTDGEEIHITNVQFDVQEAAEIPALLSSAKSLESQEKHNSWRWSEDNKKGQRVHNGFVELSEKRLTLTTNSKERGQRGKAMIEQLLGSRVRYRTTTYEDMTREIKERLRKGSSDDDDRAQTARNEIPREINEALVLDHLATRYRAWLDEAIPALKDKTPREAAKDDALREKLIELIHGLESMYEHALKRGDPAYDPSWMWNELALGTQDVKSVPPPLAFERIEEFVPGAIDASGKAADQVRRAPGFDEASTLVEQDALNSDLEVQRLLRSYADAPPAKSDALRINRALLTTHLLCMASFELHKRKTFWVDESLVYLFGQTDVDVMGRDIRAPFPSFALVFTDRNALSLAERHLANEHKSPLAGHILKVATVYVTEERVDRGGQFRFDFAVDALGADAPEIVSCQLTLDDDKPVEEVIERSFPKVQSEKPLAVSSPLRGLVQIVLNAILYATSAGVEPEIRRLIGGGRIRRADAHEPRQRSGEVYYLPGVIDISHIRNLQELERAPSGRPMVARFMVRGHWRRPGANWKDQRMRWIRPYWKGPDLASVIEKAYRLKP